MKANVLIVEPAKGNWQNLDFRTKIDNRRKLMQEQRNAIRKSYKLKEQEEFRDESYGKDTKFINDDIEDEEFLSYIDNAMKQNTYETVLATIRAFNLQLLIMFLESFIGFVIYFFYLISVIVDPSGFNLSQKDAIICLMELILDHCIVISIIVVSFEAIRYQNGKTKTLVNWNIIHAQSDAIRSKLLAFSQQIESNVMEFKVAGFFVLDGSVILSMISYIATYLIILLQTLGTRFVVNPYLSVQEIRNITVGQSVLITL